MTDARFKADRTLKQVVCGIDAVLREAEQVKANFDALVSPPSARISGIGITRGSTSDIVGNSAVSRERLGKKLDELQALLNERCGLFNSLLFRCDKLTADVLTDYYLHHKLLLSIAMDRGISLDSCNRIMAVGRDKVYKRIREITENE